MEVVRDVWMIFGPIRLRHRRGNMSRYCPIQNRDVVKTMVSSLVIPVDRSISLVGTMVRRRRHSVHIVCVSCVVCVLGDWNRRFLLFFSVFSSQRHSLNDQNKFMYYIQVTVG